MIAELTNKAQALSVNAQKRKHEEDKLHRE
jgi:hypothetical protein